MRALLQRVCRASVAVDGERVSAIGPGLLVALGVARGDDGAVADKVADKIRALRIFPHEHTTSGAMTLAVGDREILCVSQFTLLADPFDGNRPSFAAAAPADEARTLYHRVCDRLDARRGVFAAHMMVESVNDGPVTIVVDVP